MLIEKLKHMDLESSSNLEIQDYLKEADQYNFLQKRQTLLSKIQSVISSNDIIKSKFLRMRDQAKKSEQPSHSGITSSQKTNQVTMGASLQAPQQPASAPTNQQQPSWRPMSSQQQQRPVSV